MKLINILEFISDENIVKVFDYMTGETLGIYDGKNSLDERLNNLDIVGIYAGVEDGKAVIEITVFNE